MKLCNARICPTGERTRLVPIGKDIGSDLGGKRRRFLDVSRCGKAPTA